VALASWSLPLMPRCAIAITVRATSSVSWSDLSVSRSWWQTLSNAWPIALTASGSNGWPLSNGVIGIAGPPPYSDILSHRKAGCQGLRGCGRKSRQAVSQLTHQITTGKQEFSTQRLRGETLLPLWIGDLELLDGDPDRLLGVARLNPADILGLVPEDDD